MRHWVRAVPVIALLLAGCGGSGNAAEQQRELTYQVQIGRIDARFAHAPATVKASEAMLAQAVGEYDRITVPAPLRSLGYSLVADIRAELRSLRAATAALAAGSPSRLSAAEKQGDAARAAVSQTLKKISATVNSCRTNASDC